MSDILLSTKFHIPLLHGNLVNRPQLIQRLNDGLSQHHRLTLITAPAGYGKSTLLSEWASQLDQPVAWLSLEAGENIPVRFWTYFITALSCISHLRQAGFGEVILQTLQSPQPAPMEVTLTNLLNELSNIPGQAILVLDDLHTITEGQIHQDLVFFIEHLPLSGSGLHLVAASRSDPPWPLARWRVSTELTELRPIDLRFSYEETVRFLNQTLKIELSSHNMSALQERTEGWIAGLQMAAITLQGRFRAESSQGVSGFIESFTGTNRFILDYLMDEVIKQQPAERGDFLEATSILEQFTAPLCDALLERQDSQVMLNQIEQANLFLIPLDDERQWYRYHHLFADLLRKRLTQTQPELINELHLRASEWYMLNNFQAKAISHALEAGDVARVNDYVAGNALAMVEHAELMDLLKRFERIPVEQIKSKPWLWVAYAWVKAYADPTGGMDLIFRQTEQSISKVEDASERQHLSSNLAGIRAYVAWVSGYGEKAWMIAREALESLPEDDWIIRCHLLNIQGSVLQYLGSLSESIQAYEAAMVAGQKTGRLQETFFANSNLASVKLSQGQLHQAFSISQRVLNLAEESGQAFNHSPVLAHTYATLSLVQLEWNEVESAISTARRGVTLAENWKQVHALHYSLLCLSRALCAAGDFDEAFEINHRSKVLVTNVSSGFFRLSACDEIWLHLAKGNIYLAAEKYKELDPLVGETDKKGRFLVTKASLLNALGQYSEVASALEGPVCEYDQKGEYWFLMNLMPLQALALYNLGREGEALEVIERCLAFAEPEGYVRVFVDRGVPMHRLLQVAASRGIRTEYIHRLLPAFRIPEVTQPLTRSGARLKVQAMVLPEPLSERELEVLRLLNSPLTSEAIGRELYISTNTVHTHIKNIYGKLAVHRRIEAVQRAKELKLM